MSDSSLVKHILIAFSDDVSSLLQHWSSKLGTAVSQLTQNSLGEVCLADQGENVIEECLSEIEFAIHYKRLLYAVDLLNMLEEETLTLEGVEWNAGEVQNRMEALADAIGTVEIGNSDGMCWWDWSKVMKRLNACAKQLRRMTAYRNFGYPCCCVLHCMKNWMLSFRAPSVRHAGIRLLVRMHSKQAPMVV